MDICFTDHNIPEVSLTAIAGDRIFYVHENMLCSYSIDSKEIKKLFSARSISHLFILHKFLCAIHANKITKYSVTSTGLEEKETLLLMDVPMKAVSNLDGIALLYSSNRMEYYTTRLSKVIINGNSTITDIALENNTCYALTKEGTVYRALLDTGYINLSRPLRIVPEPTCSYTNISADKNSIFLFSEDLIEKYAIEKHLILLEYSLQSPNNKLNPSDRNKFDLNDDNKTNLSDKVNLSDRNKCEVRENLWCGNETVLLDSAPFQLLPERLYNFSNSIGISKNRLYFFNKVKKADQKNKIEFEGFSHSETSNNVTAVDEELFTDENLKNKFLENLQVLKKCEILRNKADQILPSFKERISELKRQSEIIEEKKREFENRKNLLLEKISEIKEKSKKIKPKNLEEFYRRMKILNSKIDTGLKSNALNEDQPSLKEKLKIQRRLLQDKIILLE